MEVSSVVADWFESEFLESSGNVIGGFLVSGLAGASSHTLRTSQVAEPRFGIANGDRIETFFEISGNGFGTRELSLDGNWEKDQGGCDRSATRTE